MPVGGIVAAATGKIMQALPSLSSAVAEVRTLLCGGPELSLWPPPHTPRSIWIVELLGKERGAIRAHRSGPFEEPPVITDLLAELLVAATLARILR